MRTLDKVWRGSVEEDIEVEEEEEEDRVKDCGNEEEMDPDETGAYAEQGLDEEDEEDEDVEERRSVCE